MEDEQIQRAWDRVRDSLNNAPHPGGIIVVGTGGEIDQDSNADIFYRASPELIPGAPIYDTLADVNREELIKLFKG